MAVTKKSLLGKTTSAKSPATPVATGKLASPSNIALAKAAPLKTAKAAPLKTAKAAPLKTAKAAPMKTTKMMNL